MKFANLPDAGCTTLFGSLPCTWGSGWQSMRRPLQVDGPTYTKHMDELYPQLSSLLSHTCRGSSDKGGFVTFKWPAYKPPLERTLSHFYV